MQINYLDAISSVLSLMQQPDSICKNVRMHRTCYTTLFKYLFDEGIPFSMESALGWLDIKKSKVSYETYTHYRNALLRLDHYLIFGNISSEFYLMDTCFYCRSGMSESFFRLTYELAEYYGQVQNPSYYHTYSVAIKDFFRLATASGIFEPENITIDILIDYWNTYCLSRDNENRKKNAAGAITVLMKYLYLRGDVPSCYQSVLVCGNVDRILKLKTQKNGTAFHPSMELESKKEEYLDALNEMKYMTSSMSVYQNDFSWYFLFLELNHMVHSSETVYLWNDVLPDCPNQKKSNCSVSAHRFHTIVMFDNYLSGISINNAVHAYKRALDNLPMWSNSILSGFIESRNQDGMSRSTLNMCSSAGCRFFQYLDGNGINSAEMITPEAVKDFHNQDFHSTPESKNAYSSKLRQLLRYMSDKDLVSPTLSFAVSTSYAPHRNIVDVLSDDMVDKIYDYRNNASTPMELRDTAMVMLGLRMGMRGSDILKLQVTDFDWNAKTVSFIQQKTQKALTLPVPTDVGNSVYKYIISGRPVSAGDGNGYIFVRHQAPCVPLKVTTACRAALKRILSKYGFELSPGQGFHMTRKTFATNMLRADNELDSISNALGHAMPETASVYLELDEEKMRLCPIDFGGVIS